MAKACVRLSMASRNLFCSTRTIARLSLGLKTFESISSAASNWSDASVHCFHHRLVDFVVAPYLERVAAFSQISKTKAAVVVGVRNHAGVIDRAERNSHAPVDRMPGRQYNASRNDAGTAAGSRNRLRRRHRIFLPNCFRCKSWNERHKQAKLKASKVHVHLLRQFSRPRLHWSGPFGLTQLQPVQDDIRWKYFSCVGEILHQSNDQWNT